MRKMVVVCLALALAFGFAAVAGAQKAAPEKVTVTGEVICILLLYHRGRQGHGP